MKDIHAGHSLPVFFQNSVIHVYYKRKIPRCNIAEERFRFIGGNEMKSSVMNGDIREFGYAKNGKALKTSQQYCKQPVKAAQPVGGTLLAFEKIRFELCSGAGLSISCSICIRLVPVCLRILGFYFSIDLIKHTVYTETSEKKEKENGT